MGSMQEWQRPDGGTLPVYLATPEGPVAQPPGVILLQEWWGLNGHIRGVADRLATHGYRVALPDLYRGHVTTDAGQASQWMAGLDWSDVLDQDVVTCVHELGAGGAKVAVLGFCLGGALAVACAAQVKGLQAAVSFYGIPPAQRLDPATIGIALQGHFAARDDWCTPKLAQELEAAMRGAGAQPQMHHYEAEHAFFNDSRPEVYDSASAELAWSRTLAFLQDQL